MWNQIRQFIAAPVFEGDEEKARTAALLNPLLLSLFVVEAVAALGTIFIFAQKLGSGAAVAAIFLITVASKLLMQRGRVRAAGLLFVVGAWVPVSAIFVLSGQRSMSIMTCAGLTVIAGLVLGRSAAVIVAAASSLAPLAAIIAESLGYPLPQLFPSPALAGWVMLTVGLAATVAPLNLALGSLGNALGRARSYAAELEEQHGRLESLVVERTTELTRRSAYLGATTAIAREVSGQRDPQILLDQVARVISEQFGFYHAGIFLVDEHSEVSTEPAESWVVLRAASSEGGRRMVVRGHRLRVGEGMVGDVARSGHYRIAQDVRQDGTFLENPDLPETRSEIALPLLVRNQIIGVLDVQSTGLAAFSEEDVTVLQALADQVSVAISNARLFQQVEQSLEVERRTYGEQSRAVWQELFRARTDLAFLSDERGIAPAGDLWEPQMKVAVETGQMVAAGMPGGQNQAPDHVLAMPIRVRDQVIGVVDGRKPDGMAWSADEISLLSALTEQLSAALEGAQLYDATQRRAAREQLARQIVDQVRAASDIEGILQVASEELGRRLGASKVVVRLGPESRLSGVAQAETGKS